MKRLKTLPQKRKEQPAGLDRLVIIVIYAACLLGAVLCWMMEYNIPHLADALLGAGTGAAIFIVALLLRGAARWITVGTALGVWAIIALALRHTVARGAVFAADLIYSRFTEVYVDFQTVLPPDSPAGMRAFAVFLPLAGFLLAALLAGAVLGLRSLLLTLAVTLPFFWFAFANTGLPPVVPTLLLICGWCGLLFRPFGRGRAKRTATAAKLRFAAMGLCCLLVLVIIATFPAANYRENKRVLEVRNDLENIDVQNLLPGFLDIGIGARTLAARNSTRVNLSATGNLTMGEGNAFSIKGQNLFGVQYFRGFSCSEYTGRAWRQGDAEAVEQTVGDFSPLANPWYVNFWKSYVPEEQENDIETDFLYPPITVRPGEKLPYSPAPYFLARAESEGKPVALSGDAYLRRSPGGAEYEAYYTSPGFDDLFADNWSFGERSYYPLTIFKPDLTNKEFEELGGFLYYEDGTPVVSDEVLEKYYVTVTLEEVMTDDERAYIDFISEEYTRLPEGDLAETLLGIAKEVGIEPASGIKDWHATAYDVAELIKRSGTYTRSPGNHPVGADFVEYFLTQSKRGYCIHFASAGATMLRALGVPARYVEGFTVPREVQESYSCSYPENSSEWIDIPNANAHAWVEVWEPGIGWVPLEVTPGGADVNQPKEERPATATGGGQDPGATGDTPEGESSSEAPESSSRPESSSSEPQGGTGDDGEGDEDSGGGLPKGARVVLFWAALVVVAAMALVLVPTALRKRREKRFGAQERNGATLEMYAYLEKLEPFGVPPGEEAYQLACKAKFSGRTITEEERQALLETVRGSRKRALESLPLPKRIWFFLRGL